MRLEHVAEGQGHADRLVVGLTGETDTALGVRLLQLLRSTATESHVVICDCVRRGADGGASVIADLATRTYDEWNQAARISSGSFLTLGMVVVPCSPRSLASISMGYANTLIHRAADVTMKEGRPLDLLVTSPLSDPAERRHAEHLAGVPGVRVLQTDPAAPAASIDALLRDVLGRFGLTVAKAAAAHLPTGR